MVNSNFAICLYVCICVHMPVCLCVHFVFVVCTELLVMTV